MCKNLDEWLTYIKSRYVSKVELGLERISIVANAMNLVAFSCPVIKVAGTNCKGSSVAYLESIFIKAGFKVGAFISPHLLHFNERIRICGSEIDDQSLCDAFAAINKEVGKHNCSLTYIEFVTLAALYIFKTRCLDVLVLEIKTKGSKP